MRTSGFSSNQQNPLLVLNRLPSQDAYRTVYRKQFPSYTGIQRSMPNLTCLERSGYWSNSSALRMGLSDRQVETFRKNQQTLEGSELARLKRKDPVAAENNGLGPVWGETTYGTAHTATQKTRRDAFFSMDRSLIGKKKDTGYSYDQPMYSSIAGDRSFYVTSSQRDFRKPSPRPKPAGMYRVKMEDSSYSRETVTAIGDRTAKLDTSGYYCKQPQVTKRNTGFSPRKIMTGYSKNEALTVGPPGDPRTFKTGKTITMKRFNPRKLV
jgi:hypothetical protein